MSVNEKTENVKKCPVCGSGVTETAKFCSECGINLAPGAPDWAWIAAMQERIKQAKSNDLAYTIFAAVGAIAAIAIPFIVRFILLYTMDAVSWLLTGVGLAFFVGGYIGTMYDDRKVKQLTRELEEGRKKGKK